MPITPFTVDVDDETLADLRRRLVATRQAATVESWGPDGVGWELGTDPRFLRHLCAHWATEFDWRRHERSINSHPQYTVEIDGQSIHFVHARAAGGDGTPLLVMNGWPSNFYECLPLVERLTAGTPAFDVVIPSLPGFGFSSPLRDASLGPRQMADLFAELMTRLGYTDFIAHGGDVGAAVAEQLRCGHPDRLLGVYVTNLQGSHTVGADPSPAEQIYLDHARTWWETEGAYAALHRTKPMSIAAALSDSPSGLAAWIVEKWRAWSGCDEPDERFTLDDLCAILTIYWVTNTIGSSMLVYHAAASGLHPPVRHGPVPVGVAEFPDDVMPVVRQRAEAWFTLVHYSEMPRGGHFAALEVPDLLADDLRRFAEVVTRADDTRRDDAIPDDTISDQRRGGEP